MLLTSILLIKVDSSSLSFKSPAVSVINIRVSALTFSAIFAAAVSAFILYIFPKLSHPTVAIIGIYLLFIIVSIKFVSISSISPTNPKSSFLCLLTLNI